MINDSIHTVGGETVTNGAQVIKYSDFQRYNLLNNTCTSLSAFPVSRNWKLCRGTSNKRKCVINWRFFG